MIKLPSEEKSKLLVCDLEEGDIADILYNNKAQRVYVFKQDNDEGRLSMVSLTDRGSFWTSIKGNLLPVIRILTSGDTLEIA